MTTINANDPQELAAVLHGVANGIQKETASAQATVAETPEEFQAQVMHCIRVLGDGLNLLMHATALGIERATKGNGTQIQRPQLVIPRGVDLTRGR